MKEEMKERYKYIKEVKRDKTKDETRVRKERQCR